jgi:hypothetical protein
MQAKKQVTMTVRKTRFRWLAALGLLVLGLAPTQVMAQAQCGVVDSISMPIDTNSYVLTQDYASSSVRHHGRYHTAEDWADASGNSLGQPVRAIARGRVTHSAPGGWGRDGGVLILEHTMPDSTVVYSVYGHMTESDTIPFPTALTCVNAGDPVGVIADIRPAPHIHFEIKTNNPTLQGAGYEWENPSSNGWQRPSQFVRNWQAWLQPAHAWHYRVNTSAGPQPQPVQLDDNSLIFLDAGRLGRLTPDGRNLWRVVPDQPVVGLVPFGDAALMVYANGTLQPVSRDGSLGERWAVSFTPDSPPMPLGGRLIFHLSNNALAALDLNTRQIVWSLRDVPPVVRWHSTGETLALLGSDGMLRVISPDGALLDSAQVRDGVAFATAPDGALLAYTTGGLWRVSEEGMWSPFMETAPPGGSSAALAFNAGTLYLYDGEILQAVTSTGETVWAVTLPRIRGNVALQIIGNVLLLTSNEGHIMALQAGSGALCDAMQAWGDGRSPVWQQLDADGTLRLSFADQLLGLNWTRFIGACG